MTVNYKPDSPYYQTQMNGPERGGYLGTLNYRAILPADDDVLHVLTQVHQHRPDMLAFDLYENANLWWVFSVRNRNVIVDPIWDFVVGIKIYIPKRTTITASLGI
jgi:hypothetical protein